MTIEDLTYTEVRGYSDSFIPDQETYFDTIVAYSCDADVILGSYGLGLGGMVLSYLKQARSNALDMRAIIGAIREGSNQGIKFSLCKMGIRSRLAPTFHAKFAAFRDRGDTPVYHALVGGWNLHMSRNDQFAVILHGDLAHDVWQYGEEMWERYS